MGHVDSARLERLLGPPELAWLVDRGPRRMERGLPLNVVVSLSSATPAQRDAVARLLGRRPSAARSLSVSLVDVDRVVRRSGVHDGGLAGAIASLHGPVFVRPDARAADRAWTQAFEPLELACAERPAVAAWIAQLRSTGIVKRLAGGAAALGAELLIALRDVIHALPCKLADSLAAFSARILGRAHALHAGTSLGGLAPGAARAVSGIEPPGPDESPSEARREAWAAAGVLCDELSSMVLTVGLPGDGSTTGKVLSAAQAGGEPMWLTLRQLVRSPPSWSGVSTVLTFATRR